MDANNPAMTVPASHRLRSTWSESGPSNSLNHERNKGDKTDLTDARNGSQPRSQAASSSSSNHKYTLTKDNRGWRRIIRNFSPSWFSVTMGTGIVSIIFLSLPYTSSWLFYLGIIFFILNLILFSAALIISIARYTIWPEIWGVMIQDSTNSLFLGTIPMGFATLIEAFVMVCVPRWGSWAVYFAWGAWMLDSIVAVVVTVTLGILLMSASHQRSLDTITAAQLLPIAATIVAAGTGSRIAATLTSHPPFALGTLIACYIMWGMSMPMALSVLVIYYQRLALHKMPPREVIVSAFLPLGPLGFGGFTILQLGKVAKTIFPLTNTLDDGKLAGSVAYVMGFFIALIFWGYGLIFFAFALASIHKSRPFPFNMGWWGFTFPLGVYSSSTILIGEELPSRFFRVLGTVFGACVVLLWVVIAAGTARGAWSGELFHAPCLANLKEGERKEKEVVEVEKGSERSRLRSRSRSSGAEQVQEEEINEVVGEQEADVKIAGS